MDSHEYINLKKLLYKNLLSFIDSNDNDNHLLHEVVIAIPNFEKNNLCREELILFLRLIIEIFNNHHRTKYFLMKIDKILQEISEHIKQTISSLDFIKLCESNKLFILFLMNHQIIVIDDKIANYILSINYKNYSKYSHFFYPEIKKYLNKKTNEMIEKELIAKNPNIFSDFDQKRLEGENDSTICSIIRKDSVDEFISYITQTNLALSSRINPSIFETNSFLITKNPSLIEYAAFFGSLKTIQYLLQNNIELTSSLWSYAIHGRNLELIQLLEQNNIEPPHNSYEKCYAVSIKCHHNEIADYIKDHYLITNQNKISEVIYKSIFKNYNYGYFPSDININNTIFFYLCNYEYFKLVEIYLKPKEEAIKSRFILKKEIF